MSLYLFYRLLCSVEGKYLIQETTHDSTTREDDDFKDNSEIVECVNFSCDMPILSGRGFMEVSTFYFYSDH